MARACCVTCFHTISSHHYTHSKSLCKSSTRSCCMFLRWFTGLFHDITLHPSSTHPCASVMVSFALPLLMSALSVCNISPWVVCVSQFVLLWNLCAVNHNPTHIQQWSLQQSTHAHSPPVSQRVCTVAGGLRRSCVALSVGSPRWIQTKQGDAKEWVGLIEASGAN